MAQLYTNRCHIPGEPDDPMAQLEVYPQRETIVLRIGVFPLESVSGGMIRSRHRRLRFSARSGPRRIGVTVSRSGAVDLRYRDETLARSEWEQASCQAGNQSKTSASRYTFQPRPFSRPRLILALVPFSSYTETCALAPST